MGRIHEPVTAARARSAAAIGAGALAFALPLVGLVSLLLRSQLDPQSRTTALHFVVFGLAGGIAYGLGFAAGEAAELRGDARVLLLSLAFMATGGFMLLHSIGTHKVLFTHQHAGFQVAISVGLLVSACSRAPRHSSTSGRTSAVADPQPRLLARRASCSRWRAGSR